MKLFKNIRGSLSLGESLALKAVSVLLALILWITILGFKREEIKKNVKLEPLLPPGVVITNRIPSYIQFTLSGPRVLLKDLEKKLKPIRPDLRRTRETTLGFTITEDMIGELPSGVRVLGFYPPNVIIRLEELSEAYVQVKPTLKGNLAAGYEIVSVTAKPNKIAVTAPKSYLQGLESIGTEPVDIEGLSQSKDTEATAEVDTTLGYQLSREKIVQVKILLRKVKK